MTHGPLTEGKQLRGPLLYPLNARNTFLLSLLGRDDNDYVFESSGLDIWWFWFSMLSLLCSLLYVLRCTISSVCVFLPFFTHGDGLIVNCIYIESAMDRRGTILV